MAHSFSCLSLPEGLTAPLVDMEKANVADFARVGVLRARNRMQHAFAEAGQALFG